MCKSELGSVCGSVAGTRRRPSCYRIQSPCQINRYGPRRHFGINLRTPRFKIPISNVATVQSAILVRTSMMCSRRRVRFIPVVPAISLSARSDFSLNFFCRLRIRKASEANRASNDCIVSIQVFNFDTCKIKQTSWMPSCQASNSSAKLSRSAVRCSWKIDRNPIQRSFRGLSRQTFLLDNCGVSGAAHSVRPFRLFHSPAPNAKNCLFFVAAPQVRLRKRPARDGRWDSKRYASKSRWAAGRTRETASEPPNRAALGSSLAVSRVQFISTMQGRVHAISRN